MKKTYEKPVLKKWGTVADLTKNGQTHSGSDAKGGSGNGLGIASF